MFIVDQHARSSFSFLFFAHWYSLHFFSLSLHQLQVYAAYKATYSLLIPANKIKIENYMVHSLTER